MTFTWLYSEFWLLCPSPPHCENWVMDFSPFHVFVVKPCGKAHFFTYGSCICILHYGTALVNVLKVGKCGLIRAPHCQKRTSLRIEVSHKLCFGFAAEDEYCSYTDLVSVYCISSYLTEINADK